MDALLTSLFPVLPFLEYLDLSLSMRMSKRAMLMFASCETANHIRVLKGIRYDDVSRSVHEDDPLTHLVSCCERLEELEIIGPGLDDMTMTIPAPNTPPPSPAPPLCLPHLRSLTILSLPSAGLLVRLLHSTLPSLTSLVITPYGDTPYPASLVSLFLHKHGAERR